MSDDPGWTRDLGKNSVVWDRAKIERARRRIRRAEWFIGTLILATVVGWVLLIMRVMS